MKCPICKSELKNLHHTTYECEKCNVKALETEWYDKDYIESIKKVKDGCLWNTTEKEK